MADRLPTYDDLDIRQYSLVEGYYTLGFIKQHFPDWCMITPHSWGFDLVKNNYSGNYQWLEKIIQANLGRKILIMPWDEAICYPPNRYFADLLNRYADKGVVLGTQFDHYNQLLYKHQHGIRCTMIELPWWPLNDCLCYHAVRSQLNFSPPQASGKNFLCMMNRPEEHKRDLLKALMAKSLHNFGTLTIRFIDLDPIINAHCEINQFPPYTNIKIKEHAKMAAQTEVNGVWISANVENFLKIEQQFDMPLIINAETTMGQFFPTEKRIWPTLLGRFYMIHGHTHSMAWLQRFVSLDQTSWIDLAFDSLDSWTVEQQKEKLDSMLDRNQVLIKETPRLYSQFRDQLEMDRHNIAQNLYEFFCKQLLYIDSL